jgi:type II secretory pathway pseudopilin PulG
MNNKRKFAGGLTLVEAVVAMAVLAVVVLGALGYQYYAALHSRIASAQITATRTAQLLLEDWKSTGDSTGGGLTTYDPSKLGLGFSAKLSVPAHWNYGGVVGANWQTLNSGVYAITVDGVPMVVMLRYDDDTGGQVGLWQLTVIVNFGTISMLQTGTTTWPANRAPIVLTTYVRL